MRKTLMALSLRDMCNRYRSREYSIFEKYLTQTIDEVTLPTLEVLWKNDTSP
jgi:hypothetical protein